MDKLLCSDDEIPPDGFRRDSWNDIFRDWLERSKIQGADVIEVGVWLWYNVWLLLELGAKSVVWSDYNSNVIPYAIRNVQKTHPELAHKFKAIPDSVDLLDHEIIREVLNTKKRVFVVACIPQVARHKNQNFWHDDIAHYYYFEDCQEEEWNNIGLGLNSKLLRKLREANSEAIAVLNTAVRVWEENLFKMFKNNWYQPEILAKSIIPQCPTTNLSFFESLEDSGILECQFFEDPDWKEHISAKEAEKRRLAGIKIYHEMYVVQWNPQKQTY